jgi:hypothetical protein
MIKMPLDKLIKLVESKGLEKKTIYVAIPDREKDVEVFNKIWRGTFKATISHIRILWKHKDFFRRLQLCVENGAIEKIIDKGLYPKEIINNLLIEMKSENEVLRYLLKYEFLPLDRKPMPDGTVSLRVASQAFDELDELIFDEAKEKCYNWLADLFDITRSEFDDWG